MLTSETVHFTIARTRRQEEKGDTAFVLVAAAEGNKKDGEAYVAAGSR
jgi:hypothetical protein